MSRSNFHIDFDALQTAFPYGTLLRWLVEKRCDVFLPVAMGGAEDHDAVLDGESVQVVQHHMVRLG